jgi:hypothetical protein
MKQDSHTEFEKETSSEILPAADLSSQGDPSIKIGKEENNSVTKRSGVGRQLMGYLASRYTAHSTRLSSGAQIPKTRTIPSTAVGASSFASNR